MKEIARRVATRMGRRLGELPRLHFIGTAIMDLCERQRVDVVLDIGAHAGQYGRFMRNLGYRGLIWSFEPLRESYEVLVRRAAGDPDWRASCCGVGDRDGTYDLQVAGIRQFSSLLTPSAYSAAEFGAASAVERVEHVQVRRFEHVLADLAAERPESRIFTKLDTQGYDLRIIEGAGAMLPRVVGLQSEVAVKPIYEGMPTYAEVLPRFLALGFELFGVFPVTRDRSLRIVELDCLFIHA